MINDKLSILLLSPLPPPAGGIATWTKKYIDRCNQKNIKNYIVNTSTIGLRSNQINRRRNLLDEVIRTIRIIKNLKRSIKRKFVNIVHLNSSCGTYGIIRDYWCAKIIKKNNLKLVTQYHCNIEDQIKNRVVQKIFLRKLVSISDKNLVLNLSSQDYLNREFGKHSIVVSNFIDNKFIIDKKFNIIEDVNKIVYIGHVQNSKGLKEIIAVAKAFPEIEFILAGPISTDINGYTLTENIVLKGSVNQDEVRELLRISDIFLFPTYSEGFSIALLEAMAMGLPIITTCVGANQDMLESNGGILVPIDSPNDIIEAINVMKDINLRRSMSNWNIHKVKRCYTTDEVMEQYINIYNNL